MSHTHARRRRRRRRARGECGITCFHTLRWVAKRSRKPQNIAAVCVCVCSVAFLRSAPDARDDAARQHDKCAPASLMCLRTFHWRNAGRVHDEHHATTAATQPPPRTIITARARRRHRAITIFFHAHTHLHRTISPVFMLRPR